MMIEARVVTARLTERREWSLSFVVPLVVDRTVQFDNDGPSAMVTSAFRFVGATDVTRTWRVIPGMKDRVAAAGTGQTFILPDDASLVLIAATAEGPATIRMTWLELEPEDEE